MPPSRYPQAPDAVEAPAAGQPGAAAHGIEPVIGHLKNGGRLGRIFLNGRDGDKINAFRAGAGYNTHVVFRGLLLLLAPQSGGDRQRQAPDGRLLPGEPPIQDHGRRVRK